MLKLTHVSLKDCRCTQCGGKIAKGEKFRQYRERALSHREAFECGAYPARKQCAKCMIIQNETADHILKAVS